MTDATDTNSSTAVTDPKFTADQVEKKCPDRLRQIGNEIAARIKKADKQIEQAENHSISIERLIAQAKELCDDGGFNTFQKTFFPNLGKSRVYELLAIGTNKKSDKEIKANTRARVAKHRANKAASSVSVTVTDKQEAETQGASPAADGLDTTTTIVPKHTPQPEPSPSKIATGDAPLADFSLQVLEIIRRIRNKDVERFAKTSVTAEHLAKLGKYLTDLAILKRSKSRSRKNLSRMNRL